MEKKSLNGKFNSFFISLLKIRDCFDISIASVINLVDRLFRSVIADEA